MNSGTGIYFDGTTSARLSVTVDLGPSALRILAADGRLLAEWPYAGLESQSAPDNILRLGLRENKVLARLEIIDPQFATEIDARADSIDRSGAMDRRKRASVIGWSVAATISLLLVAYFGVPALAGRLSPLVPRVIENKLGAAVDAQVRSTLDTRKAGAAFECGNADSERPGRAAINKIIRRLETAAALPAPLLPAVVRRREANAIALPGAHIYVYQGLIDKAESADELAAVIAHEIGHIAHRDGTKSVLQAAGLSFLFGMMLGDFVGGGAVVVAAKTVMQSSYARDVEASADAYGVALMNKAGANGRALGTILTRIGGATEPGMKILMDHPETKARVAAINAIAPPRTVTPFLDAAEWAALKKICG
ncbi:MAG: M48 family metallopeptidase [Hyphomicrobiales bacterium]